MVWEASTDGNKQTPINMTNHAYWNLSGNFKDATIASHKMQLNCDKYLPMDAGSIPTGEMVAVKGSVFDFTGEPNAIGDKERLAGAIDGGGMPGIDHAFLINRDSINSNTFQEVGLLHHSPSGRKMRIFST